MKENNYEWTFGDAVYYVDSDKPGPMKVYEHPKVIRSYTKNDVMACRYNYVVNDDKCLGAAILAKKDTLVKYLGLIRGKIVYAEDYAFQLMTLKGIQYAYFPQKVIFYEVGTGISTTTNVYWAEKLNKDKECFRELILNECDTKFTYDKAVKRAWTKKDSGFLGRVIYSLCIRSRLTYLIERTLHGRRVCLRNAYKWWKK